ncbi:gamma-glutamyl phosphate reductase [Listeria floridensis FSL S10-1187]|uniref:Gamma-glutamyl phosphate reductase n=1 Tax=Listeria floridensis FSL S10-1187 TaxID=1265817 RepID=A0ABN0RCJ1_9LIST|nr:glutamate-5-semialdehyde dehydrogenase [Listeria floridensis]EUJ27386.1 gamma-glutamyl phosphate reductase [Listeria floridensis FSL S10-1187]
MTQLDELGKKAKRAAQELALRDTHSKNEALFNWSKALLDAKKELIDANQVDISKAKENGIAEPMIDRLLLTEERIESIAAGVREVAELADPIGAVDGMWVNEAGLTIGKKRVPLGVIGIIYESRPNVTVDAAALTFKSGNAVILRGGKEAFHSNLALVKVLQQALSETGFPADAVQFLEDTSHETARKFMQLNGYLDVLIPRGSGRLIQTVLENATVPVIETGVGNCHIYADAAADIDMAANILVNAKTSRPSVCNAAETLLVHKAIAADFLPEVEKRLAPFSVELRAEEKAAQFLKNYTEATEADFETEFLDFILAVKVVDSLDEAIEHINRYGTKHSEAIVSSDYFAGKRFQNEVDAAAVYINASTRFTDGSEFGFGAEIGISTQKLHARGPMGLHELTTTKYIIFGEGQIR